MLKEVHIRNYVLIDRLDIDFRDGFSVMTGETGAGKSIILGALNLLLGGRADSKTLSIGADKCTIEGCFSIGGYGLEEFFQENFQAEWVYNLDGGYSSALLCRTRDKKKPRIITGGSAKVADIMAFTE